MLPAILVVAALDTKAEEADFLRRELERAGCHVVMVDIGMKDPPKVKPNIAREEVLKLAGVGSVEEYPKLLEGMKEGLVKLALNLYIKGKLAGILGLGGGVGTYIATAAMRALPSACLSLCCQRSCRGISLSS